VSKQLKASLILAAGGGAILALTFLAGYYHGIHEFNKRVSWDGDYPIVRPVKEFAI